MPSHPDQHRFSMVQSTGPAPGRPQVRVESSLPGGLTELAAMKLVRARAAREPGRRFQLMRLPREDQEAAAALVWDSHAPS